MAGTNDGTNSARSIESKSASRNAPLSIEDASIHAAIAAVVALRQQRQHALAIGNVRQQVKIVFVSC
jgi:hypothetical protein